MPSHFVRTAIHPVIEWLACNLRREEIVHLRLRIPRRNQLLEDPNILPWTLLTSALDRIDRFNDPTLLAQIPSLPGIGYLKRELERLIPDPGLQVPVRQLDLIVCGTVGLVAAVDIESCKLGGVRAGRIVCCGNGDPLE